MIFLIYQIEREIQNTKKILLNEVQKINYQKYYLNKTHIHTLTITRPNMQIVCEQRCCGVCECKEKLTERCEELMKSVSCGLSGEYSCGESLELFSIGHSLQRSIWEHQ